MKAPFNSPPNSSQPQSNLSEVLSNFWDQMLLKLDADDISAALKRIEKWTNNQPELTSALCEYAIQYADESDGKRADGAIGEAIDRLVQQRIVEGWEDSSLAPHFNKIRQTLLSHDRRDSLLIEYIRIFQRGKVPANNTSEQFVLLRSGLVEIARGNLRIANPIYAKVFDLSWVEQQLPGITKPVAIISPKATDNSPSSLSKLYSKIAIAACGVALLGAAVSSYMKESGGQAIAISEPNSQPLVDGTSVIAPAPVASELPTAATLEPANSATGSAAVPATLNGAEESAGVSATSTGDMAAQKAFFDNGEEHAKNSRWVLMMRQFCSLSPNAIYYAPAQKHLAQWGTLYPEDIKIAKDIVIQENAGECVIATE